MRSRPRCLITLESACVLARHPLLKMLQSRLGLSAIADAERFSSPFAALLHRIKALARVPDDLDVLMCGAWLPDVPVDPLVRDVYRDAAVALRDAFEVGPCRHVMVCMDVCPHEAFETIAHLEEGRCMNQDDARRATTVVMNATPADSPFENAVIERISCPPFAIDTPSVLDDVANTAYEAIIPHLSNPTTL